MWAAKFDLCKVFMSLVHYRAYLILPHSAGPLCQEEMNVHMDRRWHLYWDFLSLVRGNIYTNSANEIMVLKNTGTQVEGK